MPPWVKQALSKPPPEPAPPSPTSRRAARRSGGSRKAKPTSPPSPSSSSPEAWEVPVKDGTIHSTEPPPASSSDPQRHGPEGDVSGPVQELPTQATTVPEQAAVALETEPENSSSQADAYMAFFCTSSQRAKLPALPLPLRFLGAPCRCHLDTDPMPHLLLLNLFTTLGHRTPLEDWLRDTRLAPARPLQLPSCSSEFLRSKLPPPLPHSPLNLYGIASLIENLLSLVIAPAALLLPRWHSMATTPEDAASDDDFLQDTPDSLVLDRQSSDDHQPPDLGHGETTSLGTPGEPASSSLDRPYQPINAGTPRGSSRAPDAARPRR